MKNIKELKWNDISIKQFLEINKILKSDGDTLDKDAQILTLLTGTNYFEVPISQFNDDVKKLAFLQTDVQTVDVPSTITLNGKKYKVTKNADAISTAQYIDFSNYTKLDNDDKLIKIVGTFIIPDGHTYGDGYSFEDVFNDVETMPFPIANSIAFFLLKKSRKLLRRSIYSLSYQIMKNRTVPLKKRIKAVAALDTAYKYLVSCHTFYE